MEATDMAAERSPGILPAIIAPPPERTTASVPPPNRDVRQAPAPQPEKLPPEKKPLLQRMIGSLAFRLLAAGTVLGGAGYAAYATIPPVHQAVDQQLLEKLGLKTPEVPSTFDNNAEKQMIGESNIKRVTSEEAKKEGLLTPTIDLERKTVTMLFPFILPPNTTATLDKSEYETRTIKHNEPRGIVPQGSEIVIPEGMHYVLIAGNPEWGEDPNSVYGISTLKYDEEKDISIGMSFSFYDNRVRKNIPISTILQKTRPQEVFYPNLSSYRDWQKQPISDGKTPLGITTVNNQLVSVKRSVFKGTDYSLEALKSGAEIKDIQIRWQQQNGKLLTLAPPNQ